MLPTLSTRVTHSCNTLKQVGSFCLFFKWSSFPDNYSYEMWYMFSTGSRICFTSHIYICIKFQVITRQLQQIEESYPLYQPPSLCRFLFSIESECTKCSEIRVVCFLVKASLMTCCNGNSELDPALILF